MKRFIEGDNRQQITLLPESLDEYIDAENPVRIVDLFVDQLDLGGLGFSVEPAATGRPSYHPSTLLKLYVYGYLNRIQSSRRLEREAQRNIELMWLLGRPSPDFKTIADFRRDNGEGICNVCRQLVVLCRQLNFFTQAAVAIDGNKFKAVNAHDRNFTRGKLEKRMQEIDRCIERYLTEMDTADRQPAEIAEARTTRLKEKMATPDLQVIADRGYYHGEEIHACEESGITPFVSKPMTSLAKANGRFDKEDFVFEPEAGEYQCPAGSRLIWRFSTVDRGALIHKYWSSDCPRCSIKDKCTPSPYRRVARGEDESSPEAMQKRLDRKPEAMRTRRQTVEHPFGTLKDWMGATHFLTRTLERVSTEMSLHVLAYNMKCVMKIMGIGELKAAMQA